MNQTTRQLETGWLPDTPIGDSVLRRFLANQADLQQQLVAAVDGRSARTSEIVMTDSRLATPLLNQAVLLRPIADVDDPVLDDLAAFYADSHGLLLSAWPTPELGGRGWQLVGHPMFVVRGPSSTSVAVPSTGFTLRRAGTAEDLALVEQLVIDGYPLPELAGIPANRVLGAALLGGSIRHRIGYLNGTPVAAAANHVSHGVNNLCLAATQPAARRRGVWQALVEARCADAPDQPAVAFTSDDSRPGFIRLGFLPIIRFTLWVIGR